MPGAVLGPGDGAVSRFSDLREGGVGSWGGSEMEMQ